MNKLLLIKNHLNKFVHIGKCGGSSIKKILSENNLKYNHIHVQKPRYNKNYKYLIVIRNPIKRFISAFNWRLSLIEEQKYRFDGEYDIINKYKNINNLINDLENFDKNNLYIHHINENINYYLEDIIDKINDKQIIGILCQETLNEDIERIFNIKNNYYIRKNFSKNNTNLSEIEYGKLKKYLGKDYKIIDKLYHKKLITKKQYDLLRV